MNAVQEPTLVKEDLHQLADQDQGRAHEKASDDHHGRRQEPWQGVRDRNRSGSSTSRPAQTTPVAMAPTPRPTSTEAQKTVNRYRPAGLIGHLEPITR